MTLSGLVVEFYEALKAVFEIFFVDFVVKDLWRLIAESVSAVNVKACADFVYLYAGEIVEALLSDVFADCACSVPYEVVPFADPVACLRFLWLCCLGDDFA